jgi:predicted RNA binding protein YcfA (HicA-like mRNA interferase family)
MSQLQVLKPSEVVRILLEMGFVEARQIGSRKHFRHSKGRCTTVTCHQAWDISPPLHRQIEKDIGMTAEEFIRGQQGLVNTSMQSNAPIE